MRPDAAPGPAALPASPSGRHEDAGAAAAGAGDPHLAAERQRALAHAQQPHRSGIVDLLVGDAAAVVAHLHQRQAALPRQVDPGGAGGGVADDVLQRREQDAIERGDVRVVEIERRPAASARGSASRCAC